MLNPVHCKGLSTLNKAHSNFKPIVQNNIPINPTSTNSIKYSHCLLGRMTYNPNVCANKAKRYPNLLYYALNC